jgi:hypothetical protein
MESDSMDEQDGGLQAPGKQASGATQRGQNSMPGPSSSPTTTDSSSKTFVNNCTDNSSSGNGSQINTGNVLHGEGAYSAILQNRNARFSIKNLHGDGEADCRPDIGNFFNKDDLRIKKVHIRSFFTQKQNVSFSFDPTSLTCNNCENRLAHSIIKSGSDHCSVFILSDQCFPPVLPAVGPGDCINIIRIENGSVNELAKLFVDVFAGAHIPVGSLILLVSVSQLATIGTAAYAENFVRASKFLSSSFSDKVVVRPGVPVLLGGATGIPVVRSMLEVAAWADNLSGTEKFPSKSRKAMLLCLTNAGVGPAVQAESFILQLPIGLHTFEKKSVVSGGWENLFKKISPFDIEAEKTIIDTLIAEANKNFATNLATQINYSRVSEPAHGASEHNTVIVVGASHADNLGPLLSAEGFTVRVVKTKSWNPNSATVAEALADLEKTLLEAGKVTAIIYMCLDSAAYYSYYEDSIIPARRDLDNSYHIDGAMILAPAEMFVKSVKVCIPLFNAAPTVKKLILSPLPRYWLHRCCEDIEHVSNLGEDDYEEKLFTGLDSMRRTIKDIIHTSGVVNATVCNGSQLCSGLPGSRLTSQEAKDALAIMWGEDPVHPSEHCYKMLAGEICSLLSNHPSDTSTISTPAPERPLKRPRWLEADSSNMVAPRGASSRGGPWRGKPFYRGRGGPRGGRRPRRPNY